MSKNTRKQVIRNIHEEAVVALWKAKASASYYWQDKKIELVYPGRRASGGGCDFEDAVFWLGGRRITGNVEIHIRTSYWYLHRHHLDPRYEDVALHVVLEDDNHLHTVASNGKIVPTIALSEDNDKGNRSHPAEQHLCRRSGKRRSFNNRIYVVIYDAAEARLSAKTERFRKLMADTGPEQLLYRFLSRALGYSLNCAPFEELTQLMTFEQLKTAALKDSKQMVCASLVGTAGLLPSQRIETRDRLREDEETRILEDCWIAGGNEKIINRAEWTVCGVRPQNRPLRRLIALGSLLWRFREEGLMDGIIHVIKAIPVEECIEQLRLKIMVDAEDYWGEHVDFGLPLHGKAALLGKAKAAELIVNAVLPFACAYGEINDDADLISRARRLYYAFPAAGRNKITEYMGRLLGLDDKLNRCAELQGLLYIFHNFCRQKRCCDCPVAIVRN